MINLYNLWVSFKTYFLAVKRPVVKPIEPEPIILPPVKKEWWEVDNPSEKWGVYPAELKVRLIEETLKIGREGGLTDRQIEDMAKTINCESGYNPYCVNRNNPDGYSRDVGLCQFSTRYYLKEFNMTEQEAIFQPLKCLQIMAKCWKGGRAKNWECFKQDLYLSHKVIIPF
jgi:hypothetical protein